jgi:predicted DNA binding CopG/RHH family protein
MTDKLQIPEFRNEADEAKWWAQQEDRIAEEFERAAQKGELGRGTAVKRAAIPTTTIRLDPADIQLARVQAQRKGLRYQTYLKMLIHEALRTREKAS